MNCPKCRGNNVSIQMVEKGSKTKKGGNGLGGHAYNATRGLLAVSTLGMSNLIMPKAKGKEKTKNVNVKMCICQDCGNSWEIK